MFLKRTDYAQVSGTNRGILSLLPLSTRQGLVLGDQSGTLSLFSLDSFTASVMWSQSLRNITHLEVSNNEIYVSSSSYVYSFSSTGKESSCFDTNVAEALKSFKVQGPDIWTAGKYLYNHYTSQKEADYIILQDTINDLCISSITGDLVHNAVLACNDKSIRVIQGTNTAYTCMLPSAPSTINMHSRGSLLVGAASGSLGLLKLEREQGNMLWSVQGSDSEITALCSHDMLGTGVNEVILARSDGNVEVYSVEGNSGEVSRNCETSVSEGVTSLVAGSPQGVPEIILSTFSGKILGLCDASRSVDFSMAGALTSEISSLRQKLEESKKQYVGGTNKPPVAASSKVSHKLSLLGDQAAYCLVVESQFPIGMVLVQAEMPIELLDNDEHEASISTAEEEHQTLITYRYADTAHTRCKLMFRNSEGQPGALNVYVVPSLDPKIAQTITVEIKPLSLHEKVMSLNTSDRPLNTVRMTGTYSKNEMHGWISQSLPDVPPSTMEEVVTLYYTSCVIGSILIVSYASGWAEFRSDSVSVLAILKESIAKNASFRKIHIETSFIEAPDSCEYVIKLIEVHIAELQELETKFQLIEAMKEIQIQGDLDKFGEEFVGILENADNIKAQYEKYPKKLQFFQGMISDLYVDYCKFRGMLNFAERIPNLQSLLANFDSEVLSAFFKQ